MGRIIGSLCFAAGLGISGGASAGAYLGAGVGQSHVEEDNIDTSTGYGVTGGYWFNMPMPLFIELDYADSGEMDVENSDRTLQFEGASAFVGAYAPLAWAQPWAKVGYHHTESSVQGNPTFDGETNEGLVWGLGVDWRATPRFGLRLEFRQIDGLFEERDEQLAANGEIELEMQTVRLSALLHFGAPAVREPVSDRRVAGPRTSSVRPAAPVAAPAPQPAFTPMPGSTATTTATTPMHDRAVAGEPPSSVIPAGASVQVRSCMGNADGQWCLVRHGAANGWVRQDALR